MNKMISDEILRTLPTPSMRALFADAHANELILDRAWRNNDPKPDAYNRRMQLEFIEDTACLIYSIVDEIKAHPKADHIMIKPYTTYAANAVMMLENVRSAVEIARRKFK